MGKMFELKARIALLREALDFYATPSNWIIPHEPFQPPKNMPTVIDYGKKAREAILIDIGGDLLTPIIDQELYVIGLHYPKEAEEIHQKLQSDHGQKMWACQRINEFRGMLNLSQIQWPVEEEKETDHQINMSAKLALEWAKDFKEKAEALEETVQLVCPDYKEQTT